MPQFTPIIVGVGDIVNRSLKLEDALEPADLIFQSIQKAIIDTGAVNKKLQSLTDSISVVRTWTWPYPDLVGLLADRLSVHPKHKEYTDHGGNQPARIFDEAAQRIARGESKVAVIAGGEALASLNVFAKADKLPPPTWTKLPTDIKSVFSPTNREIDEGMPRPSTTVNAMIGQSWAADNPSGQGLGAAHNIGAPIHIYPLYENGFRARRGQSIRDNHIESARLYGAFAEVAGRNEFAWGFGSKAETEKSIAEVAGRNRMICFPYPLLMNAFNTVNLAAACILTSTAVAEELGIPRQKWVYPLGGAGTSDNGAFWERPNYYSAPCISQSLDAALKISKLTEDQIDAYDFYSCFPIVPKLACAHLGLSLANPEKPVTLIGGLTSFGGAGNNYSMHALTAMTRELRKGTITNGLVLANGGVVTYQYAVCMSNRPRKDGSPYPVKNPLPKTVGNVPVPRVEVAAEGEAVVETYTVEFDRENKPLRAHIVGRLKSNDHRFLANHGDESTLQQLSSWVREPVGRGGYVRNEKDKKQRVRNLFVFGDGGKL